MLLHLPQVLSPEVLRTIRERLASAPDVWIDGRVTAGYQGALVKRNLQIEESTPLARELGDLVLAALERNPLFISAVLPNRVYPPLFNRYETDMHFGSHVDGALRLIPGAAAKLRTDVSITVFLSSPDTYEGGELQIEDNYGVHEVKLPAGDAIVYPATSVHRVLPVTRGARIASFFWVQSLVQDDAQRTLLFDLDTAIQRLNGRSNVEAHPADEPALRTLVNCYHNLLRMWSAP